MNYILRKNKNNLISETDFQLSSLQVDSSLVCNQESSVGKNSHGSLTILNYLCSKKAAAYLGISEGTLRNLCSNGQIKYFKFGRRNRFQVSDLDSLLSKARKDKNNGN